MIKEFPVTAKQVSLITAAQTAVEQSQRDLNVVAQAIMAGFDVGAGELVSVDSTRNVLNVEIPDEA